MGCRLVRLLILSAFLPAALLPMLPTPVWAQSQAVVELERKVYALRRAGKSAEALPVATELVRLAERQNGKTHRIVGATSVALALVYDDLGRAPEAEAAYRRAIAIMEKAVGPGDPEVAIPLHNLATMLMVLDRLAEAEPLYRRSLAIREKRLPPNHPEIAASLNNLGNLYRRQSRFAESESSYQRAIAILQQVPGATTQLNQVSASLANQRSAQARYAEAIEIYSRVIASQEREFGVEGIQLGPTLAGLATVYSAQGRFSEAEAAYKRSFAIREKALGPTHYLVADTLSELAALSALQGRHEEAEAQHKRALALREQFYGPDATTVASSLNGLANLYSAVGRYADAEPLLRRSLAIYERIAGPGSGGAAGVLQSLALVYRSQGRFAEAEPLLQRSVAIWSRVHGPDHPNVAGSLSTLAWVLLGEGRLTEAATAYRRALAIVEQRLGPDHMDLAYSLYGLAEIELRQGQPAAARPLAERALAIREASLGASHGLTGRTLHLLGRILIGERQHERAIEVLRRASVIRAALPISQAEPASAATDDDELRAPSSDHAVALWLRAGSAPAARDDLMREAFEAAQQSGRQLTGTALAQMAVRASARTPAIARIVREQQDLARQRQQVDRTLIAALAEPRERRSNEKVAVLRRDLEQAETRLKALTLEIERQVPAFAELTSTRPLALAEAQRLLAPDEALLAYLPVQGDGTYVFAITREGQQWARAALVDKDLTAKVAAFRQGLDGIDLAKATAEGKLFDLGLANELHEALVAPVAGLIRAKRHLLVVPAGPLTSLPFHMLVEARPGTPQPSAGQLDAYRTASWLIRRHAVTVLPTVASLKALRVLAKASVAPKPLVGFADPVLGAVAASAPGAAATRSRRLRAFSSVWRGSVADLEILRTGLDPLPETQVELKAVAASLGAEARDLHVSAAANETRVKQLDLSPYRVVYFATHGLVAGEIQGLGEPALVMTLPSVPTAIDDGLLTASEVAQLSLDADWVVLSACNTAAGDTPGADALSGLARAFFYAGSRALLVSHWRVESAAAVRLTTSTFAALARNPALGRAEALRRAMLAMIDDTASPWNAYPDNWAPFSVVGEGGR